jgi:hypothetical protein
VSDAVAHYGCICCVPNILDFTELGVFVAEGSERLKQTFCEIALEQTYETDYLLLPWWEKLIFAAGQIANPVY